MNETNSGGCKLNRLQGLNASLNRTFNACSNIEDVIREIKNYKGRQLVRYYDTIHRQQYAPRRTDVNLRHQDLYDKIQHFNGYAVHSRLDHLIDHAIYCGWLVHFNKGK